MQRINVKTIASHEMCNATARQVIPAVNELIGLIEALTVRVDALEGKGKVTAAPKKKSTPAQRGGPKKLSD